MSRHHHFLSGIVTSFLFMLATTANAQVSSWVGQEPDTDFGSPVNWTSGIPGESTIAAVGPHGSAQNTDTELDQNRTLGGLLVSDGMHFSTNGHELRVNNVNAGGLSVAGSNLLPDDLLRRSTLDVQRINDLEGDEMEVDGDIRVLDGGVIRLHNRAGLRMFSEHTMTIDPDSWVGGYGDVTLGGNAEPTLNNNGVLWASNFARLRVMSGSYADLDGDTEAGIIDANGTLSRIHIEADTLESFDGTILIGRASRVNIQKSFGGWDFGQATVEFNSNSPDARSRFDYRFDNLVSGTTLLANGHGVVGDEDPEGSSLSGTANIIVADKGSLLFENTSTSLTGTWNVGDQAVLDFQGTLESANSVAAVLSGGRVMGADLGYFNNTDPQGIRGYGKFELPVSNTTVIAADGGELVIDGTGRDNDWDGIFDNGELRAEAGDLRLVSNMDATTRGHVRVVGRRLQIDGFTQRFDGNVLLSGATVASDDIQLFTERVDVTRISTVDSDVAFQNDVHVNLEADLSLTGHNAFYDSSAKFFGEGDLINEVDNGLRVVSESIVGVDVINRGILSGENAEAPGLITFTENLENFGTIVFNLGGDEFGDYSHFVIENELQAIDGTFRVSLTNDFDPMLGDEYDFLDFGSFIDDGILLDLPELQEGLFWDSSDFVTAGILRINTVPEPAALVPLTLAMLGLVMRSRRKPAFAWR